MPVALRIFTEPQLGATYEDQLAVARESEALGFDAFFRSDHYLTMGGSGEPGATGHRRGPGGRHVGRADRAGPGHGLVRAGAHRLRHPVPLPGRALRTPG